MPYFPNTLPKDAEPWLVREFQTISAAIEEPVQVTAYDVIQEALNKPRDGQFVVAGTSWDPGFGPGPYIYLDGSYVPMFAVVTAERVLVACSDETTALSAATGVRTFRLPGPGNITAVRAGVNTAPTGATLQVDINKNGSSILSTKLTIDASEKTSTTAATAAVISTAAFSDDDEFSIDIDQVGSTVAGAGLKVLIVWVPT